MLFKSEVQEESGHAERELVVGLRPCKCGQGRGTWISVDGFVVDMSRDGRDESIWIQQLNRQYHVSLSSQFWLQT